MGRRVRKAGARDRERPRERERGKDRRKERNEMAENGNGHAHSNGNGSMEKGTLGVRHCRAVQGAIKKIKSMDEDGLFVLAKEMRVPYDLVVKTKELGRLPVVNFAAGGVATPADAALMMQLGVDGVFVGSGIFKSGDPARRAKAIVEATTHYNNPKKLAEVSSCLGEPMVGIDIRETNFKSYAKRSE